MVCQRGLLKLGRLLRPLHIEGRLRLRLRLLLVLESSISILLTIWVELILLLKGRILVELSLLLSGCKLVVLSSLSDSIWIVCSLSGSIWVYLSLDSSSIRIVLALCGCGVWVSQSVSCVRILSHSLLNRILKASLTVQSIHSHKQRTVVTETIFQ